MAKNTKETAKHGSAIGTQVAALAATAAGITTEAISKAVEETVNPKAAQVAAMQETAKAEGNALFARKASNATAKAGKVTYESLPDVPAEYKPSREQFDGMNPANKATTKTELELVALSLAIGKAAVSQSAADVKRVASMFLDYFPGSEARGALSLAQVTLRRSL